MTHITWFTLPHKEPEQMTPNEVTTGLKRAQLHDMSPQEDGESHSKRLKICGGDVPLAPVLSAQVPGVPSGETYLQLQCI